MRQSGGSMTLKGGSEMVSKRQSGERVSLKQSGCGGKVRLMGGVKVK